MKKHLSFFLLLIVCTLVAQRSPYFIRNYSVKEYKGYNQTWQITQDTTGVMYIASTSSVFQYDGINWTEIPVKKGAATRQILYDSTSNEFYIGSVSDFGYLSRNSTGRFQFISFVPQLAESQKKFLDVWKVLKLGKRIYFQSSDRIFIVENKKVIGTIETPDEDHTFALMFLVGDHLFIRQRGAGLMEIKDATLVKVAGSDDFSTTRILGLIPLNDTDAMILTGDKGLVRFRGWKNGKNTSFSPIVTASDSLLYNSGVLGMKWLSGNEFIVFSRMGAMFFTREMHLQCLLNKKSGLADESISEIFLDREKNIWFTHNNGFSRVSYFANALFYDDQSGYTGTLETMTICGDSLILSSGEGLFIGRQDPATDPMLHFERVEGIHTEVWDVLRYGSKLLLFTSEGVAQLDGRGIQWVSRRYANTGMFCGEKDPVIIVSERGGASVLKRDQNGDWILSEDFDMPGVELVRMGRPIRTTSGYDFWSMSRLKTALHVSLHTADTTVQFREYNNANGVESTELYPVMMGNELVLLTYNSAFRYVPSLDKNTGAVCFREDTALFGRIFHMKEPISALEIENKLYMQDERYPYTLVFGNDSSGMYSSQVMLGELLDDANIQFARIQDHHTLWVLTQQRLARLNMNVHVNTDRRYYSLIQSVHFGNDTLSHLYPSGGFTFDAAVPYSANSVSFRFSAPYFMYDLTPWFSYELIGYDTGWSQFSATSYKDYTNLPEGTYTFRVRAENTYGMISETASVTFTILPPWYRTTWAYLLYFSSAIALFWGGIRISARRLRKQKERLEKVVRERTTEVVKQKQEIELQKSKLESAYTDIQDSIQYAERIQNAILPVQQDIAAHLPESFIYFRPRNIVSGDFYWYHYDEGISFVACVDCTGHGVPGAFMSLIGNTLLNQIIIERKTKDPGKILDLLHEGVRHSLKQDTGGETRDGMDICLCVIDHRGGELKYAGANRALWYIRDGKLEEIKADKFPIAGDVMDMERRFTTHSLHMVKGDVFYMSTDGYADQFGGDKGKKFMVKQFQKMLMGIAADPMKMQRVTVEKAFLRWMGEHEQVDDVLVIGFKYLG